MTVNNTLLAKLKKRRERTVDLGEGRSVTFLRPTEAEFPSMLKLDAGQATWSVGVEHVKALVTRWSGFSDATFVGETVGSTDPIPFDADLWAEVCSDRMEWNQKIAGAILDSVVEHITERDAIAKNSLPG